MGEEYYQLNFGKYFKAMYRQKWIVILCLFSSIALALLIGKSRVPLYQAHVSFWLRETKGERGIVSEKIMGLFFIGQAGPFRTDYDTQIELMKSSLVLQNVVEKLGLPSKTKELLRSSVKLVRSSISISKIKNTSIIEVKVIHHSPEMAVKMANSVYQAYIEFNNKLFLEQEQIRLKSMEGQAHMVREEIGKTNDLITEKIKGDMYLLLMEKIAETRLNLSLGQSEKLKLIDKAEVADPVTRQALIIFLTGMMGLFLGTVLAVALDIFKRKGA